MTGNIREVSEHERQIMSVFSIIQNSQQQAFNLQMRGRLPDSAELPASAQTGSQTSNQSEEDRTKADDANKERAEALMATTTELSGQENSEADDIVEGYKDAVDLNSTLSRAVKDGADTEREMRIERMSQQIAAIKERLKFATPEKAKRMLLELQQISKDFRTASVELGKAAEKIGPDLPNGAVDVAADATVAALGTASGSSEISVDDLLGIAADLGTSLQTNLTPATPEALETDPLVENSQPQSTGLQETASASSLENAAGEDTALGTLTSIYDALETSGFMDRLQNELLVKNEVAFREASVYAYAEMQHQSDSIHRQNRIEGLRGEHEALTKIFEEIGLLAGQLETLVDKEDKEVQEAMESLLNNLAQGFELLDDDDLQQFLGVGRYASPAVTDLAGATSGSSVTISMSSISVETSVSISISGIVA
ncbi:hypothetical protein DYI23_09270 [Roseibium polysiphoniae]|uniref:Uncharacterized protein n=1 Tax=Roseibium polysiphoniae TaxID=2571221 RepID=A0A944CDE8_9HYPH|nr:hypothetical protein [Roseibium polysiphoniae]MBS8260405.1 hypothetical protein [Roseibium polysiphoniae]